MLKWGNCTLHTSSNSTGETIHNIVGQKTFKAIPSPIVQDLGVIAAIPVLVISTYRTVQNSYCRRYTHFQSNCRHHYPNVFFLATGNTDTQSLQQHNWPIDFFVIYIYIYIRHFYIYIYIIGFSKWEHSMMILD